MIYDVNCFFKRETNELIDTLRQIKCQIDETTNKLLSHSDQFVVSGSQIQQNVQMIKAQNIKLNSIISDFSKIQKRTADATKTSVGTVKKISTEACKSDLLSV